MLADALEIDLQQADGQFCLALVDTAEGLPDKLFLEVVLLILAEFNLRGVKPQNGGIALVNQAVCHLGSRPHLAMVEVVAAELHDFVVHAVLHL